VVGDPCIGSGPLGVTNIFSVGGQEGRAGQAQAIRRWKPWERSTGPRSVEGKTTSSLNAYEGGHRKALREKLRVLRGLFKM
jgi:hypothetical protein